MFFEQRFLYKARKRAQTRVWTAPLSNKLLLFEFQKEATKLKSSLVSGFLKSIYTCISSEVELTVLSILQSLPRQTTGPCGIAPS